jgi:acyl carrier protein
MPDVFATVMHLIESIIARRPETDIHAPVHPDSHLFDDLELDSLEVGELSSELEEIFGRDPFSDGVVPNTVGEVIAYYDT